MFQPDIETMGREMLQNMQLQRLRQSVERVYQNVSFYRQRFDSIGVKPEDIRTLDDIKRLPFTYKQDMRDHYPFGLFAVDRKKVARIQGSSGTKGKPTIVGYTKNDIRIWAEIVARAIVTAGGRQGDIFHNAYGYGLFTGGLGLHYGAEYLGVTLVPVSGGNTPRQITLLEDFQPRGIACTPSYILNVVETMEWMGKDPRRIGLEYGIFGAEPWSEEMRKAVENKTGLKAIDIYGLSEVIGPGIGIECVESQQGLHIAEDHFIVEVIDPKTGESLPYGEIGELVFTSLTKEACPVIRYRTGDIAFLDPEPCGCGRTHIRMSRIKGRIDDMIIIRGVNVFPSEIEAIVLANPNLAPHYQIRIDRVKNMDEMTVMVEMNDSLVQGENDFNLEQESCQRIKQELKHALRSSLLVATNVQLCLPRGIPRSEGKAVRVIDNRHL